jgi:purine-cytosine permease-like protein
MWILGGIAVLLAGYFIFRHFFDRETLKNISFLSKVLVVIFGLFILLGIILAISKN